MDDLNSKQTKNIKTIKKTAQNPKAVERNSLLLKIFFTYFQV
jgi:hypothetical protein